MLEPERARRSPAEENRGRTTKLTFRAHTLSNAVSLT